MSKPILQLSVWSSRAFNVRRKLVAGVEVNTLAVGPGDVEANSPGAKI